MGIRPGSPITPDLNVSEAGLELVSLGLGGAEGLSERGRGDLLFHPLPLFLPVPLRTGHARGRRLWVAPKTGTRFVLRL